MRTASPATDEVVGLPLAALNAPLELTGTRPVDRAEPRLDGFPSHIARRVALTTSCSDCDAVPKVDGAGDICEQDGASVQLMHNGVVIATDCYYGPWMTEIIRCLRGHHEPQEELVFHRLLERIQPAGGRPVMLEFGSFWAYYSLWFLRRFPSGKVVALEPDPAYLAVGEQNFILNGQDGDLTFVHGAIGDRPGEYAALPSRE